MTSIRMRRRGRVWLNATVLKTVVPKGTVGSNPTASAITSDIFVKATE